MRWGKPALPPSKCFAAHAHGLLSCRVVSRRVASRRITPCVGLRRIVPCHVALCHVLSHRVRAQTTPSPFVVATSRSPRIAGVDISGNVALCCAMLLSCCVMLCNSVSYCLVSSCRVAPRRDALQVASHFVVTHGIVRCRVCFCARAGYPAAIVSLCVCVGGGVTSRRPPIY